MSDLLLDGVAVDSADRKTQCAIVEQSANHVVIVSAEWSPMAYCWFGTVRRFDTTDTMLFPDGGFDRRAQAATRQGAFDAALAWWNEQ